MTTEFKCAECGGWHDIPDGNLLVCFGKLRAALDAANATMETLRMTELPRGWLAAPKADWDKNVAQRDAALARAEAAEKERDHVLNFTANGHGGCAKDHTNRLAEAMECWICKEEAARAEAASAVLALRNVRMYVASRRKVIGVDHVGHLLSYCADGGVTDPIIRDASQEEPK